MLFQRRMRDRGVRQRAAAADLLGTASLSSFCSSASGSTKPGCLSALDSAAITGGGGLARCGMVLLGMAAGSFDLLTILG
jgi:hypothetical protein